MAAGKKRLAWLLTSQDTFFVLNEIQSKKFLKFSCAFKPPGDLVKMQILIQ